MLRNADGESEILLGNTQLLGLFFLLAVLLGVSFTAGFMLGHGSFGKKTPEIAPMAVGAGSDGGPITQVVGPPASSGSEGTTPNPPDTRAAAPRKPDGEAPAAEKTEEHGESVKQAAPAESASRPPSAGQTGTLEPRQGQTFLQVAAELHDSATVTASVLNKSGFNAHIVQGPNGKLFRVLVGPVKDKADLAATRDALKRKGFLQVIVRNY